METLNNYHQANKNRWEAAAKRWAECADSRGIWNRCHQEPELVFCEKVLQQFESISEKSVAVLGSGDNQAVFALAGLEAKVTSVDISEKQLAVAKERANILGLEISFLQSDVADLSALASDSFDLVYTGGHVGVWVADLQQYYAEAARILRTGGRFIVDEYHPFRRIWKETKEELLIEIDYFDRGPHRYWLNEDVLYKDKGEFESFEFHWTMSDYINAVLRSGCQLIEVDEYGSYVGDWERAAFKGLPENLLIIAEKS
jgi:SAM-dependent methyltransferase